jgi:hypothetical protein
MKPMYPEMLPWLARKAGIPARSIEVMWIEAVREATGDCAVIESPEFWKSTVDHLLQSISLESHSHREDPLAECVLPRLPARYWLHSVTTAESVFMSGLKALLQRQDHSSRSDPLVVAT